jgi:protein O-GlcNAc transferase
VTTLQAFELALQHHQAGRLAYAEELYRKILAQQPDHADALHLLGVIAHQVGRHDVAVDLIRKALVLIPDNAAAQSNLGEAYRTAARFDEAIAAYRRALQLNPDSPQAYNNLGIALREQGQLDEAVAAYRRALELKSDYPEAHNNLGNALKDQGELTEAIAAFRYALRFKPEDARAHSNLISTLHFLPGNNRGTISEEHHRWNRQFGEALKQFILPHTNDRSPERRLRIGYVSPNFRDQVVGRNIRPLFQWHERKDFEIFCYAGVVRPDELSEEFREHAQCWRSTVGVEDEAFAEMVRRDGVDILVDLTQHMAENRLLVFARKPTPVQVSFAGYPGSTGLDAIEYRISDRYLEAGPAAEEIGSSDKVCLIDSFWCYDPYGVEVGVNALPARESGRVTFGCLNNFCKVNEQVLDLWAQVLRKVADSRLILLSRIGSHRQRTLEILEKEGVEARRVEILDFRPRREYLELYQRLDIVLDTFPYNGHTTSLDALWMGVPVVSLAGNSPVSRAGLSQLSNIGLPELVAHSEEDFLKIAVELAGDLSRLARLRSTLRDRMKTSVLMDAPRFARQVEQAYRSMWKRWCSASA